MKDRFQKRNGFFILTRLAMFGLVFFLMQSGPSFSGEDLSGLIAQGEEALARKDFEQVLSVGTRIQQEDPRNLQGYKFALIYCAMTGKETTFYAIVEAAKRNGVAKWELEELAAKILYVSERIPSLQLRLGEYEKAWLEEFAKSH